MASSATGKILYASDFEGDFDHFLRFCEFSVSLCILHYTEVPFSIEIELCDDVSFVFGGDAVDKGNGDIRICRTLVQLKRKYRDRVFLLLGNRDVNKLFFSYEKFRFLWNPSLCDTTELFWTKKYGASLSCQEFIIKRFENMYHRNPSCEEIEEHNTLENRVLWLLEHAIGAKESFEFRREELGILKGKENSKISNEEVVTSLFHEIEKGSVREFLEEGQLICRLGNSLFVHGALHDKTIGFIPAEGSTHTSMGATKESHNSQQFPADLDVWITQFNLFKHNAVLGFTNFIDLHGCGGLSFGAIKDGSKPGEPLYAYAYSESTGARSTMVNTYFDSDRQPVLPNKRTCDYLVQQGIHRVIVGHKPVGDQPLILTAPHHPLEFCHGDTCYSAGSKRSPNAQYEFLIEGGKTFNFNQLHVRGCTHQNECFEYVLPMRGNCDELEEEITTLPGDPFIGKQSEDHFFVRCLVKQASSDIPLYMLTKFVGRKSEIKYLDASSLEAQFQ